MSNTTLYLEQYNYYVTGLKYNHDEKTQCHPESV